MKVAAVVMAAVFVFLGGFAYAQTAAPGNGGQADVNALRQFQKETLPLRDEMQVKRLELRNECVKQTPDQNRIAQLEKEMIDLRTKIRAAAEKNGVQGMGYGPRGYGRGMGYGRGGRGCGYGYGAGGRGRGYGPGMGSCGGFGYGRGPA